MSELLITFSHLEIIEKRPFHRLSRLLWKTALITVSFLFFHLLLAAAVLLTHSRPRAKVNGMFNPLREPLHHCVLETLRCDLDSIHIQMEEFYHRSFLAQAKRVKQ